MDQVPLNGNQGFDCRAVGGPKETGRETRVSGYNHIPRRLEEARSLTDPASRRGDLLSIVPFGLA